MIRRLFLAALIMVLAVPALAAETHVAVAANFTEPAKDAWVQRLPEHNEEPVDNQFYARDDAGEGTLFYNGTLDAAADAVFLRVFADEKIFKTETQKPGADKS